MFKIASGASDYDYNWTETLMKKAVRQMNGISLHYYTCYSWDKPKGWALDFTDDQYYWTMGKCLEVEDVVKRHAEIMDKYDPEKRVALLVDEWGTWWDEEPGTIKGHLYQQNTMRDAMVAALSLNVFHKFTDRVRMTNIAQIANVLQSMVLTKGDQMVLTPTYYVFKMYVPHQGARLIPTTVVCSTIEAENERGKHPRVVPLVSSTCSEKDGVVTLSLTNIDLKNENEVKVDLGELGIKKFAGEILTSAKIDDHNDFGKPEAVSPKPFKNAKLNGNILTVTLPAKSIVNLTLTR